MGKTTSTCSGYPSIFTFGLSNKLPGNSKTLNSLIDVTVSLVVQC